MRKFGKTIKLFLIDGEPNGRMTCELSNWTGKAYKIPRVQIKNSYDRGDLKSPGIYLLFGKDEEGKSIVYIGEAETIIDRLKQHVSQKEFWNEVILFISKDENLNKAHIKYLENRLYEITLKVNRYKLENSSIPAKSSISESDIAEMEEFIENIKLLTNTLGHKVFEEIIDSSLINSEKEIFYINAKKGAVRGKGLASSAGFIVLKESVVSESTTPSYHNFLKSTRNNLLNENIIIKENEKLIFAKDYEFSSPSTASSIVLGRNSNGLIEWKLKDGTTLKEFETKE